MNARLTSLLATLALIIGCGGAIALLQLPQLRDVTQASDSPTRDTAERQVADERVQLELLGKAPAFGFDNLIADWVFLKFLQYFGDEDARRLTSYQLSPEYFEVILDKDPFFWDAYLFLSGSTSLYAANPQRSVEIMNEKLPLLSPTVPSRAYFIWRWKAIDELLFLGEIDAAQESFEMAAEWASVYDDEEGRAIANISRQSAEFLEADPDNKLVRINAWSSVFYNAVDDETRQRVIGELEALGAEVSISPEGQLSVTVP